MATVTWSTDANLDDNTAKLALVNGDTIAIDTNATLTQNSDTIWSIQNAVPAAVTIDAASGGKFKVDGTTVWKLPFDGSSGIHHLPIAYSLSEDASPSAFVNLTTAINEATANDASPYPETTVAVGDNSYYGMSTKFNKLWLNIGTAGVGTYTLTWEYWNGASWTALIGATNNIANMTTTGWQYLVFAAMSDWATTSVNSQTYYWIRARVSAYTSMTTKPLITQGRVDSIGMTLSTSGGSGEILGVFSADGTVPLTPASSSATGYFKLRTKTGTFSDNEAISIASVAYNSALVNSSTGGVRGWLSVVLLDGNASAGAALTVPRLGTLEVTGDWYDLGTTNGSNDQQFQYFVADYCPAIWIETGQNTNVYEPWSCVSVNRWGTATQTVATTDYRGKFFDCTAAGVITLATLTNADSGLKPPSNCRVRVPNIHFSGVQSGNYSLFVIPNATVANRPNTVTTGAGTISINKCNFSDFYLLCTQAYGVSLQYTGFVGTINLSELATSLTATEVVVSTHAAQKIAAGGLQLATCSAGGTLTKCYFTMYSLNASGDYATTLTDLNGFTFDTCTFFGFGTTVSSNVRGNASSGAVVANRVKNSTFTTCKLVGGRFFGTTMDTCTFTNTVYADVCTGTAWVNIPQSAIEFYTKSVNCVVDGITFDSVSRVQPATAMMAIGAAGCDNILLKNIGTSASYLELGNSTIVEGVAWSRSTTTATVTSTAHGLKVGDIISIRYSSSTAAIAIQNYAVATTADANTFTFTCTNGGTSSGFISYNMVGTAYIVSIANGAVANNIRAKRCYCNNTATGVYVSDNSTNNITIDNCYGSNYKAQVLTAWNSNIRGVGATPSFAAQTSVYGSHWIDGFVWNIPPNTTDQSWSRTTTTACLTSNNHGLNTGAIINVLDCNAQVPIPLKQYSITSIGRDKFTFTCVNSGSATGTLTYEALTGRIGILGNEPTSTTSTQYSVISGSPKYTSAGTIYMPTTGMASQWVTPNYVLGHTSFPIAEAVMGGGTIANHTIYYAIDKGSGYPVVQTSSRSISSNIATIMTSGSHGLVKGQQIYIQGISGTASAVYNGYKNIVSTPSASAITYAAVASDEGQIADTGGTISPYYNLYYPRAGGNGSGAATTFTVTDAQGVMIGDYVWGTNVGYFAKVTNVDYSTNTITVDVANLGTVSGVIRFNHLPIESSIDASIGIKFKWLISTTTNNTAAISSLYVWTRNTATSRAYQYPLDAIQLTLTGLKPASDVVIYQAGTETVRASADSVDSYVYSYYSTENIDIGIFKAGYIPLYIRNYALGSSNASLPVAQVVDRAYLL